MGASSTCRMDNTSGGLTNLNADGRDLARPFFSQNFNAPSSELVGRPGFSDGAVSYHTTGHLWGADANVRRKFATDGSWSLDGLLGYRYVSLVESATVDERFVGLPTGAAAGIDRVVSDGFRTSNSFHGGQIGAAFAIQRGRWNFDAKAKFALGVTSETLSVAGYQRQVGAGPQPDMPGGLLALASNLGRHTQNKFAVLPEVNFNVGYDITPRWRVFVGYNFMYLSNAIRPGGQVDPTINENQVPNFAAIRAGLGQPAPGVVGASRPQPYFKESDFWAQGINFGVQFKW